MRTYALSTFLSAALLAATAGSASALAATPSPSSTAFFATMKVQANGYYPIGIYPVLSITGSTAPYTLSKKKAVGQTGASWPDDGSQDAGQMQVNFTAFKDVVSGSAKGVNTASASAGTVSVVMLPEISGAPALLTLNFGASVSVSASGAGDKRTFVGASTTTGITLSGTMIGTPVSIPAGKLAANTVVFDNGTMRVIANARSPTATGGMEAIGVKIALKGQSVSGTTMVGNIKFLDVQAQ